MSSSALGVARTIIAREPSDAYTRCIRTKPVEIDFATARRQHASYVATLRALGVEVEVLPPLADHPDAVFVEDTAVMLRTGALITRPGAKARRSECSSIAAVVAKYSGTLVTMEEPAVLDGGDVLRIGDRLFVGLSARTNEEGFNALADAARIEGLEAIRVQVTRGLHLKSACTIADAKTVLCHRAWLDPAPFAAVGLRVIEVEEPAGAKRLGDRPGAGHFRRCAANERATREARVRRASGRRRRISQGGRRADLSFTAHPRAGYLGDLTSEERTTGVRVGGGRNGSPFRIRP
jgi:dimethylargininase